MPFGARIANCNILQWPCWPRWVRFYKIGRQPLHSLVSCLSPGVQSRCSPALHCKQQWKYNAAFDSKQEIRRIRPNIRRGIRSRTAGTIAGPSWARRLPQAERRNPAYAMVQPLELKNPAHWPGEDALINDNESVALTVQCTSAKFICLSATHASSPRWLHESGAVAQDGEQQRVILPTARIERKRYWGQSHARAAVNPGFRFGSTRSTHPVPFRDGEFFIFSPHNFPAIVQSGAQ